MGRPVCRELNGLKHIRDPGTRGDDPGGGRDGRTPGGKEVDGRNCIVIPLEVDMTVNGILTKA